ncbi:MAG: endolytic transglycosylase MltG [Pseudomonadota bacterium]
MFRWLSGFTGVALVGAVLVIVGLVGLQSSLESPGPNAEPVQVLIERGTGVRGIAGQLADAGVVSSPWLFEAAARFSTDERPLRAGEYVFPAGVPMARVLETVRQGQSIQHRFTVPEGWTVAQVMEALAADPVLVGDLPDAPAEGRLLPDTYFFERGETRAGLLARVERALTETLDAAWAERDESVPFADADEALVLASIIEKETSVAEEREIVAGVFVNRLRKSMLLQTDPTVIYALTKGDEPLGRALTRRDLQVDDPYNTYRYPGLPPGPIANPGREAIRAALNPADTEYLYFVADGTGGHAFARTLDGHNRNVQAWRQLVREKAKSPGG